MVLFQVSVYLAACLLLLLMATGDAIRTQRAFIPRYYRDCNPLDITRGQIAAFNKICEDCYEIYKQDIYDDCR